MSPGHGMRRRLLIPEWVAWADITQGCCQITAIRYWVIRNKIYYFLYWNFAQRLYPIPIIIRVSVRLSDIVAFMTVIAALTVRANPIID